MSLTSLRIFKEAGALADEIAALIASWSTYHRQVLGSQLQRALDSIGNNIAEGYGRTGTGERIQFLMYADASISEARNQIMRATKRDLVSINAAHDFDLRLRRLSISIVEYCAHILTIDPTYSGPFRSRIQKRRAWKFK